jgi:uncharacterized protein (DUF488 family)
VTASDGTLLTVGHGGLDRVGLGALLRGAGVEQLVDVRRFPGSRNNPDVKREALRAWLPQEGIAYRWEERLGGRRRLPADTEPLDSWWQVSQFAAYAAHTRTAEFAEALDEVLEESARRRVAVMCSEAVWWRCHRRLIADVAVLARGRVVRHLMHDGRTPEHRPAEGARRTTDGRLVWDRTPAVPSPPNPGVEPQAGP